MTLRFNCYYSVNVDTLLMNSVKVSKKILPCNSEIESQNLQSWVRNPGILIGRKMNRELEKD